MSTDPAKVALRSVKMHATSMEKARLKRDRAIFGARREGASLRAVAEAAGVTHQTIQNIIDREEDARASS